MAEAELFMAVSQPMPDILELLRADVRRIPELSELAAAVEAGTAPRGFHLSDGLLFRDHRIVVATSSEAKTAILYEHHSTPSVGHPGVERTFRRLATSFYWPSMRKDVKSFVAACFECQTTKYSTQKPGGLLQPLPIPYQVWAEVSMDFLTGLPQSRGFTAIMVVVDHLSKYAQFAPLSTRFDAWRVANLFVETVVKHHGFPEKLVSDRDSIFLSEVWEHMLKLSGTKLHFTTAYHPQSDGQTEVRNRGLEQYLRAFVSEQPAKWSNFLPWAELALNCFHHDGLGTSPFRALYGREPPPLIAAQPSPACPTSVAEVIRSRGELLVWLRKNLERAQQRMKDSANKHRRDVHFRVGDKVLLKLQLYRQYSVAKPLSVKLSRRFYGPFEVVERIGEVAYRLRLPEDSRIHDVFHVSLLRPYVEGGGVKPAEFPTFFVRGKAVARPVRLVERRSVQREGSVIEEGLLEWDDDGGRIPSWEPMEVVQRCFPSLLLEDKEVVKAGGVDTSLDPNTYEDGVDTEVSDEELELSDGSDGLEDAADEQVVGGRPKRAIKEPTKFQDFIR